jgi:hypothetical protein
MGVFASGTTSLSQLTGIWSYATARVRSAQEPLALWSISCKLRVLVGVDEVVAQSEGFPMMLHPSYLENDSPLYTAPADLRRLLSIAHDLSSWAAKWPGMSDPAKRCWRTIARTQGLEAMVIAWPVGGGIELHDHGPSLGAVVVVAGQLSESFLSPGARTLSTRTVVEHDGVVFGRGHVHDVSNVGPYPAVSVHVYSPVLTSMTFFDLSEGALVKMRAESYADGDAQP